MSEGTMGLQGFSLVVFILVGMSAAAVPKDNLAIWPSPAELNILAKNLSGTILFPKSSGYQEQSMMENTRFNSKFGIIVMAENTEDVQQAILFCKEYGIRPTVKSSGHDWVGRASGDHTVSINLSWMKKIHVQNDSRSESGVSGVIEPGNAWGDIYKELDKDGYLVVGGSCATVSPSGFTLGGGQGPLSRKFGLAVDNVIEFTLVTPDGSIITLAKEGGTIQHAGSSVVETYSDTELFWAVRGGGGGTYGVVTSFTFQLHITPQDGFCGYTALYPIDLSGYKVGKEVLKVFSPYLLHNMTKEWGGHVVFESNVTEYIKNSDLTDPLFRGIIVLSLLHVGGCEIVQHDLDFLFNIYPNLAFHREKTEYDTFWDYQKNNEVESDIRSYVINRFLQPVDLEHPDKMATVLSDMVDAEGGVTGIWTLLGGKVTEVPTASAAVSRISRTALGSLTMSVSWDSAAQDAAYISAMQQYGEKLYTIGNGVYYNEPDQFLDDWQEEFWGMDMYNRLLTVKKRIDKDEMFWCTSCVGSDLREHYSSVAGTPAPILQAFIPVVLLGCLYMLI